MRVLSILHEADAPAATFGAVVEERGHELHNASYPIAELPDPVLDGVGAAIVLGGAMHVDQRDAHPWIVPEVALVGELLARGIPTFGVCLGAQLLTLAAGGSVGPLAEPEIGWRAIALEDAAASDPVFRGLPESPHVFEWHEYACVPPVGATVLARNAIGLQGFRLAERAWAIQFHGEVDAEIVRDWISHYGAEAAAHKAGLDKEGTLAALPRHIDSSVAVGRELCRAFLEVAEGV